MPQARPQLTTSSRLLRPGDSIQFHFSLPPGTLAGESSVGKVPPVPGRNECAPPTSTPLGSGAALRRLEGSRLGPGRSVPGPVLRDQGGQRNERRVQRR
jgi:hypothetical protein